LLLSVAPTIIKQIGEGLTSSFNSITDKQVSAFTQKIFSGIGDAFAQANISETLLNGIQNIDIQKFGDVFGKKVPEMIDGLLKGMNVGETSAKVGDSFNQGANGLLDGIDTAGMADRFGTDFTEFLKTFTGNAKEGIYAAIKNTAGEAARALSWNILPHVALSVLVTTALPLSMYYVFYRAKHYIGSPKLATETYQRGLVTPLTEAVGSVFSNASKTNKKPIYNADISRRITDLTSSVKNIRKNNGYFQNVLFYGPGGTGKTMISDYIAKNSGMSYVKMSGGDLAQYIKRGEHVTELNKLFSKMNSSWRPWSTRPWVLFIDEAESLCKDRDKITTAELLELQNALLNLTGTQTKKFMIILATNRMEDLDEAILSRMDHKVFIGPPAEKERGDIIASYLPQFFSKAEISGFFNPSQIAKITKDTDGLTGRALFKLLNAISGKKATSDNGKLTQEMIDISVRDVMAQEREVLKRRELKEKKAGIIQTPPTAPITTNTSTSPIPVKNQLFTKLQRSQ
jgi:MoxR-like ATPase